jgi:hypothetical protein
MKEKESCDEFLVQHWVNEVLKCATRAETGHSIATLQTDMQAIIKGALDAFDIKKTSDSAANRARFKSLLKLSADTCHPSQPARKKAIEDAILLLSE